MNSLKKYLAQHWQGEDGVGNVLNLAYPIIISQGLDSLMMFINRLILADLGKEYPSASMTGSFTSFMYVTLLMGIVGYSTALVAQYLGAGKKENCSIVVSQGLLIALVTFIPLFISGWFLGPLYFVWSGHSSQQIALETPVFQISMMTAIVLPIRNVFSGFFSGTNRTNVVMVANVVCFLVFIPMSYALIYGWGPLPQMGYIGGTWAQAIANFANLFVYIFYYFQKRNRVEYGVGRSFFHIDWKMIKKYFRFGGPSGIEFFLNFFAFGTFVSLFNSYGSDAAAAVTITFSWDILVFLPMLGLNISVMSLVGQAMGAKTPERAARTTYSAIKVAMMFMGIVSVLFTLFTPEMVRLFAPHNIGNEGSSFEAVLALGIPMLKLVAVYCLADASSLIFSACLRAAGDTTWCMIASVFIHWTMLVISFILIKHFHAHPLTVWYVFVLLVIALGITFFLRFLHGRWKTLEVIG